MTLWLEKCLSIETQAIQPWKAVFLTEKWVKWHGRSCSNTTRRTLWRHLSIMTTIMSLPSLRPLIQYSRPSNYKGLLKWLTQSFITSRTLPSPLQRPSTSNVSRTWWGTVLGTPHWRVRLMEARERARFTDELRQYKLRTRNCQIQSETLSQLIELQSITSLVPDSRMIQRELTESEKRTSKYLQHPSQLDQTFLSLKESNQSLQMMINQSQFLKFKMTLKSSELSSSNHGMRIYDFRVNLETKTKRSRCSRRNLTDGSPWVRWNKLRTTWNSSTKSKYPSWSHKSHARKQISQNSNLRRTSWSLKGIKSTRAARTSMTQAITLMKRSKV